MRIRSLAAAVGVVLAAVWLLLPWEAPPLPSPSEHQAPEAPILSRPSTPTVAARSPLTPARVRVTVLDADTSGPVPGAELVLVASTARFCTSENSRRLALTDANGQGLLERGDLPADSTHEILVAATDYIPGVLPNPVAATAATIRIRRGTQLRVQCSHGTDGTPLAGAFVAISRTAVSPQALLGWGQQAAAPEAGVLPGPKQDHAVRIARSDHRGVIELAGLECGAYRFTVWHEDAVPVSGVPEGETIRLPATTMSVGFRSLYGLVATMPGRRVLAHAVRRNPSMFQRDSGWAVAASSRLYQRLRAQHPDAAIFVGLPRHEVQAERLVATAKFMVEDAGFVDRELPMVRVEQGRIPVQVVETQGETTSFGRARITLRAPDGSTPPILVEVWRNDLSVIVESGSWTGLPAGPYAYQVASHSAPELAKQTRGGVLDVQPGADSEAEQRLDHVYAPCDLVVSAPFEDRGAMLMLDFLRDGELSARLVNWSPARHSPRIWLRAGRVAVRAYGVDLASPLTEFSVASGPEVARASLTLEATILK